MYQKKKLPIGYIQDLNCKVLELPYQGEELSMVILLPEDIEDESTGLKKVPAIGNTIHGSFHYAVLTLPIRALYCTRLLFIHRLYRKSLPVHPHFY